MADDTAIDAAVVAELEALLAASRARRERLRALLTVVSERASAAPEPPSASH